MALNREQRRALLRAEIEGGDVDVANVDAIDPVVAAPVAPAPAVTLTHEQFTAMLSAIGGQGQSQGIADAIGDAIKANRQPIPENPPDQYPNRSVYHMGGTAEPRIPLAVPTFLGLWDAENGKAIPAYEFPDLMLTDAERAALNSLKPGEGQVTCTDGGKMPVRVVAIMDAMGNPQRVVIAFPPSAYDKDHRNTIPGPVSLAAQLAA